MKLNHSFAKTTQTWKIVSVSGNKILPLQKWNNIFLCFQFVTFFFFWLTTSRATHLESLHCQDCAFRSRAHGISPLEQGKDPARKTIFLPSGVIIFLKLWKLLNCQKKRNWAIKRPKCGISILLTDIHVRICHK